MFKFLTYVSFVFLLCAFVFPLDLIADNGRTKIVRSNWPAEHMGLNYDYVPFEHDLPPLLGGQTGGTIKGMKAVRGSESLCIRTGNSGEIQIGLSYFVRNSVYNQGCLPIYLAYTVGNDTPGVLAEWQMTSIPVSSENGGYSAGGIYTKYYTTITIDLSDMYDPVYGANLFFGGSFDFSFELVTANGSPYPVANYPDLFLEYDNADYDEDSPYVPEYIHGTKPFCRPSFPSFPPYGLGVGYVQTDNPTTIAATKSIEKEEDSFGSDNKPMFSFSAMEQLEVYPNPFHNEININNISDDINIRVVDINGRVIYTKHFDLRNIDSTIKLDTHTWSKGLYFCQIQSTTEVKVVKLYK